MPRRSDARARAVGTAARLFQRQGFHGTGLAQILEESGAPKGSFYFHFPGGKDELAVAAIDQASRDVEAVIRAAADRAGKDPASLVRKIGRALARWLEDSDYREGCPVTTVALETCPDSERLSAACGDAFQSWQRATEEGLRSCGLSAKRASSLATAYIAALEGAFVIARTERSTRPFRVVTRTFEDLVRDRA